MITGAMPHPHAYPIPVGKKVGEYQPYVAHVATTDQVYGGAGHDRGDSIHFSGGAWSSQPSSPRTACTKAVERAQNEHWAGTVLKLPEHLYEERIA